MNADLKSTLEGAGSELTSLVSSLRASQQACVSPDFTLRVMSRIAVEGRSWFQPSTIFPIAAGLVALLAFGTIFFRPVPAFSLSKLVACQRADGYFTASPAAPYVQAFAVTVLARDPSVCRPSLDQAVDALVRTQGASGGWENETLSEQNVAALAVAAEAGVIVARKAYKRGLRFLRSQGLNELSTSAFAEKAQKVLARLSPSDDPGLACCVALCARR